MQILSTSIQKAALLRFTRWSRSKAAAFHSLSRSVSIGRLSVQVLCRLERKTTGLLVSSLWQNEADPNPESVSAKSYAETCITQPSHWHGYALPALSYQRTTELDMLGHASMHTTKPAVAIHHINIGE